MPEPGRLNAHPNTPKGTTPNCNNGWMETGVRLLAACVVEQSSDREAAADVSRRLQGLLRVAQDVNSSLDLPVVLDRILCRAREIMGAEAGSIMLLDAERR